MDNKDKQFPLQESLSFGFQKTWEHIGFIIIAMILYALLVAIFGIIFFGSTVLGGFSVWYFFQSPISIIIFAIIIAILLGVFGSMRIGLYRIMLDLHDRNESSINKIFAPLNSGLKYLIGIFLYALMIIAGLILLIVPGIIFASRFMYFPLFIADKDAGIFESLAMSWNLTKGYTLENMFFWFILAVLTAVGRAVPFGFIFTTPISFLSEIAAYRKLSAHQIVPQ